jgi:hypothetical protein
MEQVARRLDGAESWTYLGGKANAKKPLELVVRAFDGDVVAATGSADAAPDGEPVRIPTGEGRRLTGLHFFVRPAPPIGPRLITYRGI